MPKNKKGRNTWWASNSPKSWNHIGKELIGLFALGITESHTQENSLEEQLKEQFGRTVGRGTGRNPDGVLDIRH